MTVNPTAGVVLARFHEFLLEERVEVKVFDPMDERAVKAWLAEGPRKEIIAGSVYVTHADGVEHEVGIVLYVEEHTVGHPDGYVANEP